MKKWAFAVSLLVACAYIFLELAHAVSYHWDQETFLYSYNNAFLKMMKDWGEWPQWNPYIQSGVSLNPNMPFPFSLGKILTLLIGNGVLGYFFSRVFFLTIASYFLLDFLNRLELKTIPKIFVLFLFLEYQLAFYSHEALPTNVAIVLIVASLKFVESGKFYIAGLASLYLGLALNDWAQHATLFILPLQLLLVYFLRDLFDWRKHLQAIGIIWFFGIILSLPTLIPLTADSKQSQKTLTYAQAPPSQGMAHPFFSFLSYIYYGYVLRLSTTMIAVVSIALGLLPLFWRRLKPFTQKIVLSFSWLLLLLAFFYFGKGFLVELPAIGKIFAAFNPMRPTILTHLCLPILFGIVLNEILSNDFSNLNKKGLFFFVAVFVLFFTSFYGYNEKLDPEQLHSLYSFSTPLLAFALVMIVLSILIEQKKLKNIFLIFTGAIFIFLWIFTGARYYTREIPKTFNPFKELTQKQISIFPDEDPVKNSQMLTFLQNETKKDFALTADLRFFDIGDDMFQRFSDLQIATIHGWSNLKPLPMHRFYVQLLADLQERYPKGYAYLQREGGFSYSFGARYDKKLLDLMGVKYLIAEKLDKDNRFTTVMEGEKYKIYENKEALPRAFLIAKNCPYPKIEKFSPNRVDIETACDEASTLVLTQSLHPAWRVFVDNQPSQITPAYDTFLSTALPQGPHKISFQFSDPNFVRSIYISLGALILLMSGILLSLARPKSD